MMPHIIIVSSALTGEAYSLHVADELDNSYRPLQYSVMAA
jgi:hypothetical protein